MGSAKPLGIALLGCGFATTIHARRLRALPNVRLYFASRERAKADAFARKYGGAGSFAGYETALADERVDAVVIATPPSSHLQWALAALDAGKHCVIEKPPLVRSADFDTVLAAKDRASRRVLVAENYFYKPLAVRLREVIASGMLGEVRILSINALKQQRASGWRNDPAASGGGALFEGGIHWVDFMTNLGLEVSSVQGFRPGADRSGPDRSMVVVFTYATGAVGTLYYSWETPSLLKGLRLSAIYGSRRTAAFESNGLFLSVPGWPPRLHGPSRDIAGYAAMWRDFIPALVGNREPAFSFDRARRDLQITERVYHSLEMPSPNLSRRERD